MLSGGAVVETGDDKKTMATINVPDRDVTIVMQNNEGSICITDIARYKNPDSTDDLIRSWIRNRNSIVFPGIRELLNNPVFNPVEI